MDFRFAIGRASDVAIARQPRALLLAGGAILCAAAAAVASVPAPQSASVTTALPRAAPKPAPETLFAEPTAAAVEMTAILQPSDSLESLLASSGIARADAKAAAALVTTALPAGVPGGTRLDILLGASIAKGERRLERIGFQPGRAFKIVVGRTLAGELKLARDAIQVDATPQRFRGRAGSGLFWSLRAEGVPAEAARDYLEALGSRLDLRRIQPGDEFDLVVDHMRDSTGKGQSGPLVYAALRRTGGSIQLVRWTVGSRTGWFDPTKPEQRVEGFEQPVHGRQTSRFGYRIHPILGFARFHDGVDYGAAWGTPVLAAADGVVSGTGWTGGYGRQVRIAHTGGVTTSYSHLSQIMAVPGTHVQRGQLIGLVGSSGFSTGAHLHFEVRRNGQPVDPASFRLAGIERIGPTDLAALRARAEQLRSI